MVGQVHYEVWSRRKPGSPWGLEAAVEARAKALETAEELIASSRAVAVRVSKETLDPETREFSTVVILTKGEAEPPRKKKKETHEPLCVSPSDLYSIHARETIGRLLDQWLLRNRATPFELLHRADLLELLEATGMELQHAVQKIAIPEAQDCGVVVHEVIRHYQKLVEAAIERVIKDEKRGVFPDFERESFAAAAERLVGAGDRNYLLGAGVARATGKAGSWSAKIEILLDLADTAPTAPTARTLTFQVLEMALAEILGSAAGMADLLGPELDLGGRLAAMTRLIASDTVDLLIAHEPVVRKIMPKLNGAAARLANWLEGAQFGAVRAALAQRVLRELNSPKRLRPDDAAGEIEVLRALAMCLTAAAGRIISAEQVQEAFAERSRMLVRADFVEVYLGEERNALEEVEALMWLAENVTGAANKRAASRWISGCVGALRFEKEARNAAGPPTVRLASLAALQRNMARVGFLPEELKPLQAKVGEVGGLIEADARLAAQVAKAALPAGQRLNVLVRMAAGETAPAGPAADRARHELMRLMRDPDVRADAARSPELAVRVREVLQAA